MHNLAVRLQLHKFARDMKPLPLRLMLPFISEFSAIPRIQLANRHRPSLRTEQPLLHDLRIKVRSVYRLGWRGEVSRHNHVLIALGLQSKITHDLLPFFFLGTSILAKTASSRS